MSLTTKDIETITRMLEASRFDELDLELDGLKLSLRRGAAASASAPTAGVSVASGAGAVSGASVVPGEGGAGADRAVAQASVPGLAAAPPTAAASGLADTTAAPVGASVPTGQGLLTAPLLGTFYRSPRPGEPPFVEVGSWVEPDTVVGIIEVMKLMNAVHAGRKGRVTEIFALDGALVEYGEALLRIEA